LIPLVPPSRGIHAADKPRMNEGARVGLMPPGRVTIRESKMLEQVLRWRSEAWQSFRRETSETRVSKATEWAARCACGALVTAVGLIVNWGSRRLALRFSVPKP
jgi:hypothetical protein